MKIYLDSIGCRLNQSEIETFARQFRAAGHSLVSSADQADLVVVNTCAVTAEAESDSRQKIRQAARLGAAQIVVTGCWATLNPQGAAALPGVSQVVSNEEKDLLVPNLLQMAPESFDLDPLEREPVPGIRARTRAFIKVQDGCENRCTFCITTLARGRGRSRTIDSVCKDVESALRGGAQEAVLTGVHLGSWGYDFEPSDSLSSLVKVILERTAIPRLRLSSLEPWDLSEDFFALWENPRLCPHLHLPLQSGCAATLRRMARKVTPASFAALLDSARSAIPDLAVTTDLIAGFPGEDDREFAECVEFVQQMQFAGGHVFTYSARPGTAAERMPGQVPHPVRKERNARLRTVLMQAGEAYRKSYIGRAMPVLWESALDRNSHGWMLSGLTGNYIRVMAQSEIPLWNQISTVRLGGPQEDGLRGVIESPPPGSGI